MNKHFAKEDIQGANNHIKSCSTSLAIREIKIKTTMAYQYRSNRIANIKKKKNKKTSDNAGYRQGCGETGPFIHCWWAWKTM